MDWLRRILSLWLNLSPSLPLGVYREVQAPVDRGSIVVLCLPAAIGTFARTRGYLGRGPCPGGVERLGKRVAAIPGDTVEVDADGVRINGFLIPDSRPLPSDSRGRPLMHARGGVVQPGEFFLLSTDHRRSFDSRYFGALAVADPIVVIPYGMTTEPERPWGAASIGERTRAVHRDPAAKLVYEQERLDVRRRRDTGTVPSDADVRTTMAGLALSGGGIRSATLGLGVLQALGEAGKLFYFDFLSTVSGGGFVGGWWSAWLARPGTTGQIPKNERIEPDRHIPRVLDDTTTAAGPDIPDGSRSVASDDPIHHLRLFSNYLTPRKGVFSADTWRAVVVVTRNLVLTWLVLIPLLIAAVAAAQLYFVADANPCESERSAIGAHDPAAPFVCEPTSSVTHRVAQAVIPGLVVLAWLSAMTIVWIVFSTGAWWLPSLTGLIANGLIAWVIFHGTSHQQSASVLVQPVGHMAIVLAFWGSLAVFAIYGLASWGFYRIKSKSIPWDTLRTRIVRHQTTLLTAAAALTVVLLVTAVGADTADWLSSPAGGAALLVAKAGGWSAIALSLLSAVYTSVKSAPSVRGENTDALEDPTTRVIFAGAPPLLLGVLLLGADWGVRHLYIASHALETPQLSGGMLAGIGLMALFAAVEFVFEPERAPAGPVMAKIPTTRVTLLKRIGALVVAGGLAWAIGWNLPITAVNHFVAHVIAFVVLALLLSRLTGNLWISALLVSAAVAVAYLCTHGLLVPSSLSPTYDRTTAAAISAIFVFALLYLLAERLTVDTAAVRSTALVAIGVAGAAAWLVVSTLDPTHVQVVYATKAISAIIILISTVIALGWMIDPNLLSLHNFYKSRLVRAYLGASNTRGRTHQEITDSAPGDDVFLCELKNVEKKAPIHLINTTLNLVGSRDLATAQRSAASFVLSHQFCGSMRTGYRPTDKYMSGKLTLGAAIAASGAAVSPNMGARTQSAAISLLLGLFNVRLGLWAPTPNKPRWMEAQPHLWPFYLLREALSQTNDLGTFSYLTDGGHFDNTGLYALVERGVRYIVLVDNGEDPKPCFADLGDAIRRCRIDFGAEIDLTTGAHDFQDATSGHHWTVGTIRYSLPHLELLGWTEEERKTCRDGVIVWLKPRVGRVDSVDVQQYRLEHTAFPNQTTVNQWFDEAQFESYRSLGYQSGAALLSAAGEGDVGDFFAALIAH